MHIYIYQTETYYHVFRFLPHDVSESNIDSRKRLTFQLRPGVALVTRLWQFGSGRFGAPKLTDFEWPHKKMDHVDYV
jgi:hypothetical protein